jgi:hypothetical protein
MQVTLTEDELYQGALIGARRQIEALKKGLPDKHGFEGLGWDVHIEGALGELAFAKSIDRHWGGSVNVFKTQADVGKVEVRTRSKTWYDLLIRPDDSDDAAFVLVTGHAPEFIVRGWIKGAAAKKREWLQTHGNRPPAYFVPPGFLTTFK